MNEERCNINRCNKIDIISEKYNESKKQYFVRCSCGASGWKAIHANNRTSEHKNLKTYYSKGFCEVCLRKEPDVSLKIHHVSPVADGGCSKSENLWTVCESCHGKIHYIRNQYTKEQKLRVNFYANKEKYNDFTE